MSVNTDQSTSFARMVLRIPTVVSLVILLAIAGSCKDKSPATAPATGPQRSTNSVFKNMEQNRLPLPPPDTENTADTHESESVDEIPELTFEKSPECKALEAEQKKLREQIDRLNKEVVAPAAAKADETSDAFNECQDDVGCVNNLERYEAKNRAYQNAKNALKRAERQVEDVETQLYNVNHKISAKCDTSPL